MCVSCCWSDAPKIKGMTIIYLDVCCYNRPFDSQIQTRVRLETEAKLCLQEMAKDGRVGLAWSYVLDYENGLSPLPSRRDAIAVWRDIAPMCVEPGAAPLLLRPAC